MTTSHAGLIWRDLQLTAAIPVPPEYLTENGTAPAIGEQVLRMGIAAGVAWLSRMA